MKNEKLTKEQVEAIERATPKPPRVFELGGGYYYKCFWISCNEDLTKWFNYCPHCGQKIDWGE